MQRRSFLALAGAGVLAGCSALSGPEHNIIAQDAWSIDEEVNEQYRQIANGTVDIDTGEFAPYELSPQQAVTLNVTADAEAVFDVFVLDENEYDRYRDGDDNVSFPNDLSAFETTDVDFSARIHSGDHRVVFDNSRRYGTGPEESLTVDFSIAIRLVSEGYFAFRDAIEDANIPTQRLTPSQDYSRWIVVTDGTTEQAQQVLQLYAEHVPDRQQHRGLLFQLRGQSSLPATVLVPPAAARAYRDGDIGWDTYVNRMQTQ
jgi:hypothetical protein